jgi:hypothetical protein
VRRCHLAQKTFRFHDLQKPILPFEEEVCIRMGNFIAVVVGHGGLCIAGACAFYYSGVKFLSGESS